MPYLSDIVCLEAENEDDKTALCAMLCTTVVHNGMHVNSSVICMFER